MRGPDLPIRARDLERASRDDPSVLSPAELLAMLEADDWTVQMHLCRMLPRISWPAADLAEVIGFVRTQLDHKNTFVRAWAIYAYAQFAAVDEKIREDALIRLQSALESKSAAIKVRAREGQRLLMSG